jgi:hypothetical protein
MRYIRYSRAREPLPPGGRALRLALFASQEESAFLRFRSNFRGTPTTPTPNQRDRHLSGQLRSDYLRSPRHH